MKIILTKLALASLLISGLATASWAASNGTKDMYRTPSGKVMNVFPARKKATPAKPKATPATKPAKPKPQKKVNFTLKRK